MDPASTLPENILNTKMEMTGNCDEPITLTKMEIVDAQPGGHLEESDSQHLVETQYINLHRVSNLTKNLAGDGIPADLLSQHVVDAEYAQHVVTNAQFYENTEFLSSNFTDEERRLELVAVQFIQDNRHESSTGNNNLNTELLNVKTTLPSVSSLSTDKNVMSAIVSNYAQTVDPSGNRNRTEIIHIPSPVHEQQHIKAPTQQNDQLIKMYPSTIYQQDKLPALPSLKKINTLPVQKFVSSENTNTGRALLVDNNLDIQRASPHQIGQMMNENFKSRGINNDLNEPEAKSATGEEYENEPESEDCSSQKSLPHKKRIPSKLKKVLTPTSRSSLTKCIKCTKCGEQFPNQASLNAHKQEPVCSNNKKNAFACELCSKSCANQLKFFEHLKCHYEPVITNHINSVSESSSSVEQKNKDSQLLIIDMNPSPSNELQIKDEHESEYSNEALPNFTCGKCGRVFKRQKAYDCHMSISHPKQEEIEEFSEPEDMMEGIRHVVNMVPTGDEEDKNYDSWNTEKPIESPAGSQSITSVNPSQETLIEKSELEVEMKAKSQSSDELPATKGRKQMNCPHCPRTFVHRNSLLYHIRSHTGHRPHQCELCGKSFFAAGALKIHHRLHSGDKPYKCEYCGRFFRQWGDLKYHFTSLHSNTKMFQCEYCGKDFARKYSLVVHRRIHTGEKNYICEFCTKTFRAASYLQNHRRIHTGEKPHACSVCGKLFRVRSDMKRHMKTHPDAIIETANHSRDNNTIVDRNAVDNQEMVLAAEECKPDVDDLDSEQNIKPIITEPDSPPTLNVRPETGEENLYHYQREDLVDRESTGTVYLWIQTDGNSILPNN